MRRHPACRALPDHHRIQPASQFPGHGVHGLREGNGAPGGISRGRGARDRELPLRDRDLATRGAPSQGNTQHELASADALRLEHLAELFQFDAQQVDNQGVADVDDGPALRQPHAQALADQFGIDKPVSKYFALIASLPSSDHFEMDAKLALAEGPLVIARVDPATGKKCHTAFDVLEKFNGSTTLRCHPRTNRTHQIRAHLRHAGFPLVGDKLYGGKPLWLSRLKKDFRLKPGREERPLISRVALHAEELSLTHPVTQQPLTIASPLPKDLRVALRYLREFGGNLRRFVEE